MYAEPRLCANEYVYSFPCENSKSFLIHCVSTGHMVQNYAEPKLTSIPVASEVLARLGNRYVSITFDSYELLCHRLD